MILASLVCALRICLSLGNAVFLASLRRKKQERQGAPQPTDEDVYEYLEFVGEEQRSISPLITP
ncbi:MAG: hypothetical protein IJW10_05220 [Clostridia bacterium]|nr:hypothetical protein [Clostridia bacterium]